MQTENLILFIHTQTLNRFHIYTMISWTYDAFLQAFLRHKYPEQNNKTPVWGQNKIANFNIVIF